MLRIHLSAALIIFLCSQVQAACTLDSIWADIQSGRSVDQACATSMLKNQDLIDFNDFTKEYLIQVKTHQFAAEKKQAYFNQLIDILSHCSETDSIIPHVHYKAGLQHYSIEAFEYAARCFDQAHSLWKVIPPLDSTYFTGSLGNAGITYLYAKKTNEAKDRINKALKSGWPIKPKTKANLYKILGDIHASTGKQALAEHNYRLCGNQYFNLERDSFDFARHQFIPIGIMEINFNQPSQALRTFQIAKRILINIPPNRIERNIELARVNLNIAACLIRLEQFNKALDILESILNNNQYVDITNFYHQILISQTSAFIQSNKFEEAKIKLKSIDSLNKISQNTYIKNQAEKLRFNLFTSTKQFNKAKHTLSSLIRQFSDNEASESSTRDYSELEPARLIELQELHRKFAYLFQQRYLVDQKKEFRDSAWHYLSEATIALDHLKAAQFDPDYSIDISLLSDELLDIDVLPLYQSENEDLEKFFTYFEKSKSAALLASIQYADANKHFTENYGALTEIKQIKSSLAQLQIELSNKEISSDERLSVMEEITTLNEKLIASNKEKAEGFDLLPLYKNISLPEFKKAIPSNTKTLSYYLTANHVYIFVITKNKAQLVKRTIDDDFRETLSDFIAMNKNQSSDFSAWIKANSSISEVLLSGLIDEAHEKLIIMPDGDLTYLPFESLFSKPLKGEYEFQSLPYVIKTHAISYNFSASIWNEMSDKKSEGHGLLTMAPTFGENGMNEDLPSSTPLAHAQKEIDQIQNIWKSETAFNPINKSEFITQAEQAKIVHFAGHAILNDDDTENSYLAFSSHNRQEDKLYIRDIYNMKAPGELVVLSACNTGQGEFRKGEGVMSMARAFAYAGTKSLVYSLWEVNDASTRKIMEQFYTKLNLGESKDEAMRSAKLAYLKRAIGPAQHPFYWAGFITMGDMGSIGAQKSNLWWFAIALALLSVIGLFIWRRMNG